MPLMIRLSAIAAEQVDEIRTEGEARPTKPQGRGWRAFRRVLEEYLPEHGLNP